MQKRQKNKGGTSRRGFCVGVRQSLCIMLNIKEGLLLNTLIIRKVKDTKKEDMRPLPSF